MTHTRSRHGRACPACAAEAASARRRPGHPRLGQRRKAWMPGSSPGMTNVNVTGCSRSPDRRRVLDAAGIPQLVQPARNVQPRLGADIALIDLAVIADMLDDAHRPVLAEPEVAGVIALGA